MYPNQMMNPMYDRGSANMLGKVLVFVMIAIVLTTFGVIGFSHMIRDFNINRITNEEAQRQLDVREGAMAGAIAVQNANYQAEAIQIVAWAEAEAEAERERARLIRERNTQALAREKLIGEMLIYVGVFAATGVVVVSTFAGVRLVDRRLPKVQRVMDSRPAGATQPEEKATARAAGQPLRQQPAVGPQTITLAAEDEQCRRQVEEPALRANGSGPRAKRRVAGTPSGQPVPAQ